VSALLPAKMWTGIWTGMPSGRRGRSRICRAFGASPVGRTQDIRNRISPAPSARSVLQMTRLCRQSRGRPPCRRRDSNPRHADYDSACHHVLSAVNTGDSGTAGQMWTGMWTHLSGELRERPQAIGFGARRDGSRVIVDGGTCARATEPERIRHAPARTCIDRARSSRLAGPISCRCSCANACTAASDRMRSLRLLQLRILGRDA
jgi:hypothetical protein